MARCLQGATSQVLQEATGLTGVGSSVSHAAEGRGPEAACLVLKGNSSFNVKIRGKESECSILRLAEARKQAGPVRALLQCGTSGQAAGLSVSRGKPAREAGAVQAVARSNICFWGVVVILPYS